MTVHILRITLISALLITCIFLPYTTGDYDALSVTLSTLAQLSTMAALMLVPIGIPWLIHETIKRRKKGLKKENKNSYRFAMASLVTSSVVAVAASLGAFVNNSRFLAIIIFVVCVFIFLKFLTTLRQMKISNDSHFNPTPLYLIFIPIVVVLVRFMFITPAADYSRGYAISQSEKLIRDIEAYKDKNGHYPTSLLSLWEDYKPSITSVKQFHYEPYGTAYNVYFEHFSTQLDIKEIVMYNKLDDHEMTSHNSDLLLLSQEDLDRQRGYISVHRLPQSHWKSFWFD